MAITLIIWKLAGHIDWAWVWVLAPIWAPLLVLFFFILPVLLLCRMLLWSGGAIA